MPAQGPALGRREQDVRADPERAGGEREGVELGRETVGLRVVEELPEPRSAHEELRGEREDQRNRRRDAHPGGDVGHRARQRDAPEALARRHPEGPRGVDGHGVDVADAVHGLHENRPEGAEGGQEDLALERRAECQEEQGNERRRWDGPEELDRDAKGASGEIAEAEHEADRNREQRREPEPDRPAARGLEERGPEAPGLDEVPELTHGRRHRGQVLLADETARGKGLPEEQRERERQDEDEGPGEAWPAGLRSRRLRSWEVCGRRLLCRRRHRPAQAIRLADPETPAAGRPADVSTSPPTGSARVTNATSACVYLSRHRPAIWDAHGSPCRGEGETRGTRV